MMKEVIFLNGTSRSLHLIINGRDICRGLQIFVRNIGIYLEPRLVVIDSNVYSFFRSNIGILI